MVDWLQLAGRFVSEGSTYVSQRRDYGYTVRGETWTVQIANKTATEREEIRALFGRLGVAASEDGADSGTSARVFAPGIPPETSRQELSRILRNGGELDTPSRQLARYIDRVADLYMPNLDVEIIYRLDRYGRGGHPPPFFEQGFPAVRLMESHENYNRQHQDIRVEDGREYGDKATMAILGGDLRPLDKDLSVSSAQVKTAILLAALKAAEIPISVAGTLEDMKIRPDLGALVKTRVRQEVEERLEEKAQDLKKKLGEKLQDLRGR